MLSIFHALDVISIPRNGLTNLYAKPGITVLFPAIEAFSVIFTTLSADTHIQKGIFFSSDIKSLLLYSKIKPEVDKENFIHLSNLKLDEKKEKKKVAKK